MTLAECGDPSVGLVDAHVHLYPRFPLVPFLDSAYGNLQRAARGVRDTCFGVLCLTETTGEGAFERLQRHATTGEEVGGWMVTNTHEETSLGILSDDVTKLIVIAGRQISTQERLEVLALGTRTRFDDGRPLKHVLQSVVAAGAIPIIPWGFGKWIGQRNSLIQDLIRNRNLPRFFLSDSGNRPRVFGRHQLFDFAESHGVLDLPGSDPLPLPGEHRTVGRTGFVLDLQRDGATPTQAFKERLNDLQDPPPRFGRMETALRFLKNQVALRLTGN